MIPAGMFSDLLGRVRGMLVALCGLLMAVSMLRGRLREKPQEMIERAEQAPRP